MDLIAYVPEFNLYNQDWPIYTMSGNLPPAKNSCTPAATVWATPPIRSSPRCDRLRR